jgi:hypothetical protein
MGAFPGAFAGDLRVRDLSTSLPRPPSLPASDPAASAPARSWVETYRRKKIIAFYGQQPAY